MRKIVVLVLLPLGLSAPAAADPVNDLTTYSVMLGRAFGCGIDVSEAAGRVGAWMDNTFTNNREKAMLLTIFAEGVKHHATLQRQGRTPDSCSEVRRVFRESRWP